jgi:hypothetical protein
VLKLRAVGEAGKPDFNPGDFKVASLASIWLCMDPGCQDQLCVTDKGHDAPPIAGLNRAVIGSDLAICCKTVMKKRICT